VDEPKRKKRKTAESSEENAQKNGSKHKQQHTPIAQHTSTDEVFMASVTSVVSDACAKAQERHPEVRQAVESFSAEFISKLRDKARESKRDAEETANAQIKLLEREVKWSEDASVVALCKKLSKDNPVVGKTNEGDSPTPMETAENIVFDTDTILRTVRQIQAFDTSASKYLSKVTSQMHAEETGSLQLQNH